MWVRMLMWVEGCWGKGVSHGCKVGWVGCDWVQGVYTNIHS